MLLVAEAFGALAVILNFIGYRQDDINRYLLISAMALAAVSTHFFLLGAMAAGIGCALACVRNLIAMKYRGNHILITFVLLNVGFLLLELFVLEHGLLILVAYASSLIFTVGSIAIKNAAKIRQWFILAESLGLIYAVMVGSIFGTIFNISNLCSILYKLFSDRK
jgi:hypothetical protein